MHPRQQALPGEIEAIWLAALADADIDADDALLYLVEGEKGSNGYAARYLYRHRAVDPEDEADEIRLLIDEMNTRACIGAHRVVVFTDRRPEGLAALIRHELEHGRQYERFGQELMELYGLAEEVLAERVGGLPGGGFLYQVIPVELDANAAASQFSRSLFGPERIDALLRATDKDGAAFRSLVGPPDLDTLPERMVRFFATMPDLCQRIADNNGFRFAQLLDVHWRGAGAVYDRLFDDPDLQLPR